MSRYTNPKLLERYRKESLRNRSLTELKRRHPKEYAKIYEELERREQQNV